MPKLGKFTRTNRFLLSVLSSCLFFPCVLLAAPPQDKPRVGRLADGRAYRVDGQGYQLVDQIAELEVSVDELRRQTFALEDELKQKNAEISNLKTSLNKSTGGKGEQVRPRLKEQDLPLGGVVKSSQTSAVPNAVPNCDTTLAPLYQRIEHLQSQLGLQASKDLASEVKDTCKITNTDSKVAIEEKASNLDSKVSCADPVLLSSLKQEISSLQDRLIKAPSMAEVQVELDRRDVIIKELRGEIATLNSIKLAAKPELAPAAKTEEIPSPPQVIETTVIQTTVVEEPAQTKVTEAEPPPAVIPEQIAISPEQQERAEKELARIFTEIESLVSQRDNLLDKLHGQKSDVLVQLSPLRSKSGESLEQLQAKSSHLKSKNQIQDVRIGLRDIESALVEDLRNLKRLIRVYTPS